MGSEKYKSLDGLRGLASVIVLFWHFAIGFTPFIVGGAALHHTRLDRAVSNTPLFLPFAGEFSVMIFFVLSGFVLSLSFFKHRKVSVVVSSVARRYFRLMIPACASVILTFAVMRFVGQSAHTAAATITGSQWMGAYWNTPAHLLTAVQQGFYGIFATIGFSSDSYNTSLWTMHYELVGSALVFAFLVFFGGLHRRWIFYAASALLAAHTYFLPFIVGMAMCDLWINNRGFYERISTRLAATMLVVGLVLGSIHPTIYHTLYLESGIPLFTGSQFLVVEQTIAAAFIIVAIFRLTWLAKFFELRLLQYFGRLSFSLYLVHFAIIYSLSAYIFSYLYPHFGYMTSFFVMIIVSVPVIFGVADLYARFIDMPSIAWSKRIGSWLISTPPAKPLPDPKPAAQQKPLLPLAEAAE